MTRSLFIGRWLAAGALLLLAGCGDLDVLPAECPVGSSGCACYGDLTCDDGASCSEGVCVSTSECPVGAVGCPCTERGTCEPGLSCDAESTAEPICVFVCVPGLQGCDCRDGLFCETSEDGMPMECREGVCREPLCELGTLDCLCNLAGGCEGGLVCDDGRCAEDTGQTLAPPQDPQCYTPCKGGGLDGPDGYRTCSSDGLLPGCVGGTVCVGGSCVKAAAGGGRVQRPQCGTDFDCPSFQTCIDNHCYSDCGAVDGADECREGRVCHRKVCRLTCTVGADECPLNYWCDARNGTTGYCAPEATARNGGGQAANDDEPPPVPVLVEPPALVYRPVQVEAGDLPTEEVLTTLVRHEADYDVTVTIRPLAHTIYAADDDELVNANERVDGMARRPLCWLSLSIAGVEPDAEGALNVVVPPGDGLELVVSSSPAGDSCRGIAADVGRISAAAAEEWFGTIEVTSGDHTQLLELKSVQPAGRYSGRIAFYGNFGVGGLDPWLEDLRGGDPAAASQSVRFVENGLIRRWWAFRSGALSLTEFEATIRSTETDSWRSELMRSTCAAPSACYPVSNLDGYSVYTDDVDASPIPTGFSELTLAVNLQPDRVRDGEPVTWSGRIDSTVALQYPGNPHVRLAFEGDPFECFGDSAGSVCPITSFDSTSVIGARFAGSESGCDGVVSGLDFTEVDSPWFQRAFGRGVSAVGDDLVRTECRGASLQGAADDTLPTGIPEIDLSLTTANPIADGRPLVRRIELLDGALYDGDQLFLLFREELPELFPGAGASYGYGYMQLSRTDEQLVDEDFEAVEVPPEVLELAAAEPPAPPSTQCSAEIEGAGGGSVSDAVDYAISGVAMEPSLRPLGVGWTVHYLCVDTGKFDGPCPVSSEVRYFAVEDGSDLDPEGHACNDEEGRCEAGQPCAVGANEGEPCPAGVLSQAQRERPPVSCYVDEDAAPCAVGRACPSKGTCADVITELERETPANILLEATQDDVEAATLGRYLVWRCTADVAWCSQDRADLRAEKSFFVPAPDTDVNPGASSLQELTDTGFSFRTRFRSRLDGGVVGFAPRECVPGSTPYCYDGGKIEMAGDRIDCLSKHYAIDQDLPFDLQGTVADALRKAFSFDQTFEGGRSLPTIYYGFEFLFAELLITLGDDAYAESFVTRFDLANQLVARFPGDKLEPDGIELSGAAGYELFALYLAVQSYQVALDRFLGVRDVVGAMLEPTFAGEVLIDASSATTWFKKLLRASAQKARASARIAEKYHRLGEPDLARHVVRRAYATAWLESIYFSQLMKQLFNRSSAVQKAQVQQEIETAQLVYKDALLVMKNLHDDVSDEVTFFGFTKDYVPFPALDPGVPNAFEVLLARARAKLDVAFDKEVDALADRRDFETDEAEFLSTLTDLQLDADGQLAELCGYIEVPGDDGSVSVYPATSDYAHLSPDVRVREFGNPCGLVGAGDLSAALLDVVDRRDELGIWKQTYGHILDRIEDERSRLSEQCDRIIEFSEWRAARGTEIVGLEASKATAATIFKGIEAVFQGVAGLAESADCIIIAGFSVGTNCVGKAVAKGVKAGIDATTAALETATLGVQGLLDIGVNTITEVTIPEREISEECDAARIDSKFVVRDLFRELESHAASGAALIRAVDAAVAEVQHLRDKAICIQATAAEQRQQTVDIESARNDPNIRIYRNSAIIHAERTFDSAVAAAWRATRGYEYFTNQTYAARDRLPLVRMVGHGDVTLESYLDELEDAFFEFEEVYGNPDLRVQTISIQDQTVGELSGENTPMDGAERAAAFRAFLQDPQLRNADGFVTIPFRTGLADPDTFPESGPVLTQVSPLTHNHKVRFVEVELVGPEDEDHGDDLARVYVRQGADGFGELREPDGDRNVYILPQRTAVVDVSFNGQRPLDAAIRSAEISPYRNERLRDRPLHHTQWTVVLHPTSEPVNRDFDLVNWVTDIKVHLWYTDFTEL